MTTATQTGRPLTVTTPLGRTSCSWSGFNGHEAISQLFQLPARPDRRERHGRSPSTSSSARRSRSALALPGRQERATSAASATASRQGARDDDFHRLPDGDRARSSGS